MVPFSRTVPHRTGRGYGTLDLNNTFTMKSLILAQDER